MRRKLGRRSIDHAECASVQPRVRVVADQLRDAARRIACHTRARSIASVACRMPQLFFERDELVEFPQPERSTVESSAMRSTRALATQQLRDREEPLVRRLRENCFELVCGPVGESGAGQRLEL